MSPRRSVLASALLGCVALAAPGGCNWRDMKEQDRADPLGGTPVFADGTSARHPPDSSVARSESEADLDLTGDAPPARPAITRALLERGRERFEIYCSVCHGRDGYGQGIVVRRGFPPPPSLHDPAVRGHDESHYYRVVTAGLGKMPAYRDLVHPADRWAVIAYVRALQLSQNGPVEQGGAP
jgi:mono/diheme cytochrome c family protein